MSSRWFSIRIDSLVVLLQFTVSMLAVYNANTNSKNEVSIVGLSLVYSVQLMGIMQWTIRLIVDLTNQFIC